MDTNESSLVTSLCRASIRVADVARPKVGYLVIPDGYIGETSGFRATGKTFACV